MRDRSSAEGRSRLLALSVCLAAAVAASCATKSVSIQAGERAEGGQGEPQDLAVVAGAERQETGDAPTMPRYAAT